MQKSLNEKLRIEVLSFTNTQWETNKIYVQHSRCDGIERHASMYCALRGQYKVGCERDASYLALAEERQISTHKK